MCYYLTIRGNSAALTNQIFAIYDVLYSAFTEGHGRNVRPYSNILTPVSDSVADLKNNLLMTMKNMDPEEKGEALQHISKCFMLESHKYVGRRSIERRKKRNPNTKSAAVVQSTMTDEERARLTEELLHKQPERYGADRAAEYFDRILGDEQSVVPDSETVKTREDAMMVAASIIYSGSAEFPYEVEFLAPTFMTIENRTL